MVCALCIEYEAMSAGNKVCACALLLRDGGIFVNRSEGDVGCLLGGSEVVAQAKEVVIARYEDQNTLAAFSGFG